MKRLAGLLTALLFFQNLKAQEKSTGDSTEARSLISFLKEGEVSGHIRNYFMTTDNRNGKDYYADAIGGMLRYETKTYKSFQVGISGIFSYKAFASDLNDPDAQTGKTSKWERELFDVNHPDNYNDLDRLEELYIKYKWDNSYITYGKIPVEYTPLLNESDGRMKPFAFQGSWLHHSIKNDQWIIDAGWFHKVSPRSMTEWFPMDEAIGMTDNGFQPDGTKAKYAHHIASKGIGSAHLGKKSEFWKLNFWNVYLDKVINTSWAQVEYSRAHWFLGAVWSYQIQLQNQQQLAYENRYVQPDENGQVLSLAGKYKEGATELKITYSRSFKTGRYLFPKELGRDQFYTSMPRNRIEGIGDANILGIGLQHHWKHLFINIDASTSFGIDPEDLTFNKYGIDDFYQVNTRIHYEFTKFLKGLNIDLLYVWKENKNLHQPLMAYQKSDYNQINLITNFKF